MKLYNVGSGIGDQIGVPSFKRRDFDGKVKEFIHLPPQATGSRCQGLADRDHCKCGPSAFREHKDGTVYLSLPLSHGGFFAIDKGAAFDVPGGVSVKAIRAMAPQLLTEEEMEQPKDEPPALVGESAPQPKQRRSQPQQ